MEELLGEGVYLFCLRCKRGIVERWILGESRVLKATIMTMASMV